MTDAVNTTVLDLPVSPAPPAETLRRIGWEIGEERPADGFSPPDNHVGLAMVSPTEGFAHWRVLPSWIDQTALHKGDAWHGGRLVLRLYDVSYLIFNGLNAHHIQDEPLPATCGERFFRLPRPGTWQ